MTASMNNKPNEVARQLGGIKKALALCGACLSVTAAPDVYYIWDDLRENTERRLGRTFFEQADTLARSEEWDELLTLAQRRQVERPRDSNAALFTGIAHLNRGELDLAETAFRRTVEINKQSRKAVDAWLKVVEEKRAEKKKIGAAPTATP